ncbi:hypothetical protein [Methylophilus aquaticus]|uniref:Pilus assembly protein PilP n=1 Tax=Methylophilus aquaticus TaxID=1971610 RepID=A0ABT9JS16_9PROT|nr:hypothetical protein [Methylophilus aquaticus]MDP8566906.1 hypothetical protein [Methylophilus aquaticus]
MSMRRRGIWLALLLTLGACWWVEQSETTADLAPRQVTVPARRSAQALKLPVTPVQLHARPRMQPIQIAGATLDEEAAPRANLFAAMPAGGSDVPPVEPPAPVNPYTYAGRLYEGNRWAVFLTDGQQQYVCHLGDHFADGWQVARLDSQVLVLKHASEQFEIKLDNGGVF